MSLYGKIGENNPAYLLADPMGANLVAIPCEPGNGIVPRGTVMYRKASGLYAPAAAANVVNTNQLAVLDETVDTTANATVAEDARAFRAGRLVAGKVTLAAGAALTEAHKTVLRTMGILFDPMVGTGTFDNTIKEDD